MTGIACLGIAAYTIWAAVCSVIPTLTAVSEGIVLFCAELVIFWNGIIKVYCTSVQLGLKYRVWGIVLGMVMPADLVMLVLIYRITRRECAFETEKALLQQVPPRRPAMPHEIPAAARARGVLPGQQADELLGAYPGGA